MIANGEVFKLGEDCDGVIWQEALGWFGCLRWDVEGNTNFVGPFPTRTETIRTVRAEFAASQGEEVSE